jgi:hypothetical protein
MSVTTLHGLEAVKIDVDDATTAVLSGTDRYRLSTNSQISQPIPDGDVYARAQALVAQQNSAMFETLHIAQALAICGLTGLRIKAATEGKTGVTFYAKKQQEGGTRASGSVHDSFNYKEGIIVPRRLVCEHQGNARIEYEILATWDGTNLPVVIGTSIALPTNPNAPELFTLGPIALGIDGDPVAFTQVRSFELDFGVNAETIGADSDIWDTFARIADIQPSIVLRGLDKNWFSATKVPLTGAKIEHADTTIVLRKRLLGSGTFYSDAEAEHIGITAAGMAVVDTPMDVNGNQVGETSIRFPLNYDGTNLPAVIDTTFAPNPE